MIEKNNLWQSLRGLCIMAVVVCHCPGIFTFDGFTFDFAFYLLIRQFSSFCVPAFLFISGYFVNSSILTEKREFFVKRFWRLVVPYLIWTTVYLAVGCVQYYQNGLSISYSKMLIAFVTGGATAPLYYIVVLIQLTLMTPLLLYHLEKRDLLSKLVWLISPIYLVIMYIYNLLFKEFPPFYNVPFMGWIVFYFLGMNMRHNIDLSKKIVFIFGKKSLVLTALFFCLLEGVCLAICDDVKFAVSQMKLSSMLLSVCICVYVFKNREKQPSSHFLVLSGNCSYGIFYVHELVKKFAIYFVALIVGGRSFILSFILCFLFTYLGSLFFVGFYKIIINKMKVSNRFFSSWI